SDTSPVWISLSSSIPPTQTEYLVTDRKDKKFYYYRVRAKNYAGSWGSFSDASTPAYLSLPSEAIDQLANYPNPFDSRHKNTTITYILRDDSEVTIRIFDLLGAPVKTMHFSKGENPGGIRGTNNIIWDGTNDQGQKIVQGMYIMSVEVKSGGKTTRKNWKIGVIH
ncbi:MAG: FlgD immunoglobulin-like domain containing protein, partial [Endomicrobiia bacterium]